MNEKTIETLKAALEALDTSQGFVEASANAKFCDGWGAQLDAAEKAITELRTVIATMEAQQPVAYRAWFDQDHGARWLFTLWPDEERLEVDWEPLYAAPVQPVDQFRLTGQDYADIYEQSADWDDFAAAIDLLHRRNRVEVPLYSTPVVEAHPMQESVVTSARKTFEDWYESSHTSAWLLRTKKGYVDSTTRVAWRAWQAATKSVDKWK